MLVWPTSDMALRLDGMLAIYLNHRDGSRSQGKGTV